MRAAGVSKRPQPNPPPDKFFLRHLGAVRLRKPPHFFREVEMKDRNYFIAKLKAIEEHARRVRLELEALPPTEIKYDTDRFEEPPFVAEPPEQFRDEQPGAAPFDPLAKTMADLVTPKQLGLIRHLAREAGVDPEEECRHTLRCKTDELSKRAASGFIDHLKSLQGEARMAS